VDTKNFSGYKGHPIKPNAIPKLYGNPHMVLVTKDNFITSHSQAGPSLNYLTIVKNGNSSKQPSV
jgi:hypothetical protein